MLNTVYKLFVYFFFFFSFKNENKKDLNIDKRILKNNAEKKP
ncbi:protein of unknown function [Tenacibaculum sp. 190524A02b]